MKEEYPLLLIVCQFYYCRKEWAERYPLPAGALFCDKCFNHSGRPIKVLSQPLKPELEN